jgi:hypothetical protein
VPYQVKDLSHGVPNVARDALDCEVRLPALDLYVGGRSQEWRIDGQTPSQRPRANYERELMQLAPSVVVWDARILWVSELKDSLAFATSGATTFARPPQKPQFWALAQQPNFAALLAATEPK